MSAEIKASIARGVAQTESTKPRKHRLHGEKQRIWWNKCTYHAYGGLGQIQGAEGAGCLLRAGPCSAVSFPVQPPLGTNWAPAASPNPASVWVCCLREAEEQN